MAQKPTVSIAEIAFSGGKAIQLNSKDKVVLVGPNNSGKSETLREIVAILGSHSNYKGKVISQIQLAKIGSSDDLRRFFEKHGQYIENDHYRYKGWQIHSNNLQAWSHQTYLPGGLATGFIKNVSANNRLAICDNQRSIGPDDQPTTPQHILYQDDRLMQKISTLFRQAFGKDIMFNFRGGAILPIHVGEKPNSRLIDRVSDSYTDQVRKNPELATQGDGMKSYAGILFEAVVSDLDITLIDEPEAFLHPPQMRRLGETLSSEVNGQLVVATHSSDIMRGFLEGTKGNVRILRIRREGNANMVCEASADVIQELWERPELRYSNALEGVFHEQTIICEDDSDCRLINAVADHLAVNSDHQWLDTAYVPTGGKHGASKVASVLRKIGIPTKAVFDLDFLSDKQLVKTTVEAFGGDWTDIEDDWSRLDSAIRKGNKPKSNEEIKSTIQTILDNSGEGALPRGEIKEAMKQSAEWYAAKSNGINGIPRGDARKYFKSVSDALENIGIYLVPVGEIENFCGEIGSHGPKYVTKLLTEVPLDDIRLSELRSFVERVHEGTHCPLSY